MFSRISSYPVFIPYPISWLKAIFLALLLPIVIPPINTIPRINFLIILLTLPVCFVWTVTTINLIYYTLRLGWIKNANKLWWHNAFSVKKAIKSSLIIWSSFLIVIIPLGLIAATECRLSLQLSETRCYVRGFRFVIYNLLVNATKLWDVRGNSSSLTPTIWQPWFIFWVISAAYIYHLSYLIRGRFIPWARSLWTPRRIKKNEIETELEQLRSEIGLDQPVSISKPRNNNRKLVLMIALIFVLGAIGYFTTNQKSAMLVPTTKVSPTNLPIITPSSVLPIPNNFGEGIKNAMAAAQLTQIAKTESEWQSVANSWQEAINQMQKVPSEDQNYAIAQNRIPTYQQNLAYAQKRLEMAKPVKP